MKEKSVKIRVTEEPVLTTVIRDEGNVLPLIISPYNQTFFKEQIYTYSGQEFHLEVVIPEHQGFRHIVLGDASLVEGSIGARFAGIFEAEFIDITDLTSVNLEKGNYRFTLFLDSTSANYTCISAIKTQLKVQLGEEPVLGLITAENHEYFTWLVFKQLLGRQPQHMLLPTSVIIENLSTVHPEQALQVIDHRTSLQEFNAGISIAKDILFINGHSRHYCGVFRGKDYLVGICCAPQSGKDGICFDDKTCYFAGGNKVSLTTINADKIMFNGCFTANLGNNTFSLPRNINPLFASLRGRCSEFIGNIRVGHYTNSDTYWFMALSFLGYSPAEAVTLITGLRSAEGREDSFSLMYVGNAVNTPWIVAGITLGEINVEESELLHISFPATSGLLVAILPGIQWAHWAEEGNLDIVTADTHISCSGNVLADFINQRSILLIETYAEQKDVPHGLTVEVRKHYTARKKSSGVLSKAIGQFHFLRSFPLFKDFVHENLAELEEALWINTHTLKQRYNITNRSGTHALIERNEIRLAHRFDSDIMALIQKRLSSYWNWQEEYAPYFESKPSKKNFSCHNCGQQGLAYDLIHYVNKAIKRKQAICTECGIISDNPDWNIDLRFSHQDCTWDRQRYTGNVRIVNNSNRTKFVSLYPVIEGLKNKNSHQQGDSMLMLKPNEKINFPFEIEPETKPSGFYWIKVYMVSEGGVGFINKPLVL